MSRLRIAFLLLALVAGDYAALRLIDCQVVDFAVAAAICAGCSIAAGLVGYFGDGDGRRQYQLGSRRHTGVNRARSVIGRRRARQTTTGVARPCPPHREPAVGFGGSSDAQASRVGTATHGQPREGVTWNRTGSRAAPDDPGVKLLT
jgi:hypothetical protein